MRAAAVGAAGYAVGRHMAQDDQQQQEEEEYDDFAPLPEEAFDELEKLGQLKDKGILTQEEFDAQKAKILGTT
jgi:hypothetical protein